MNKKIVLVFMVALLALVFSQSVVKAAETQVNYAQIVDVQIDDISYRDDVTAGGSVAGEVSATVPITVKFTALSDADDVKVKVYIEGYKNEIFEQTQRFRIVEGKTYTRRFTLKLPSTFDLDSIDEDLTVYVRISAKGKSSLELPYNMNVEKNQYSLNILSIDTPQKVVAGDAIPVDVVLQNNGATRLDNIYLKASIPELGIEKRIYVGDMNKNPENNHEDIEDTVNKRVFLILPRNTISGIYNIEVEAYNYDVGVTAKKSITIGDVQSTVVPTTTTRKLAPGEETTFNVVIVNPNKRMVVYTITPEEAKGLIVDVLDPVVTVPSDSSRTIKVRVKATESAEEGTHLATVNIVSESQTTEKVSFTANVEKAKATSTDSVVILTVVLAIIFVVLLIVLIVLLTKKPAEPEEFGETSYY